MATEDLQPGTKKCLRCDVLFDSWDVRKNRICPKCDKHNQAAYTPRIKTSRICTGDYGLNKEISG